MQSRLNLPQAAFPAGAILDMTKVNLFPITLSFIMGSQVDEQ